MRRSATGSSLPDAERQSKSTPFGQRASSDGKLDPQLLAKPKLPNTPTSPRVATIPSISASGTTLEDTFTTFLNFVTRRAASGFSAGLLSPIRVPRDGIRRGFFALRQKFPLLLSRYGGSLHPSYGPSLSRNSGPKDSHRSAPEAAFRSRNDLLSPPRRGSRRRLRRWK